MYQFLTDTLGDLIPEKYLTTISDIIYIITVVVICILLRMITKYCAVKISNKLNKDQIIFSVLLDSKLLTRLTNLVVPLTVAFFITDYRSENVFLNKVVEISIVIVSLMVIHSCIKSINIIYSAREVAKTYPINGLLQVFEILIFIISGIIIISIIVEKSPAVLLGGIGAMTAIITIIFKDAILGFVAGIQLTGNDMIRIGDWIEIPNHSTNGTVIDLSLTTVKVQNFDKSISLVPAYTLISESFINWRGMIDTGSRRIKRPIYIDVNSVCSCSDILNNINKKFPILDKYIHKEFAKLKKKNGEYITNIEILRAYILEYLKAHTGIDKELPLMVRQLELGEKGIPLEVYAFANTTVWVKFESIQFGIFDHIYSIIPEFGLRLYQLPSSYPAIYNFEDQSEILTSCQQE